MDAVVDNLDAYRQGFVTTLALTALGSVLALALGTLLAERRRRGGLSHAHPEVIPWDMEVPIWGGQAIASGFAMFA